MKWFKEIFNRSKKDERDFILRCVYDYQLQPFNYPKNNDTCKIKMTSGKIGKYKVKIIKRWPGGTGQKDWLFKFECYLGD